MAKAVRLKEREASFLERMQHGIPTAQPLPIARAVRLKEREASFLEKMQHGKPRHAPPVGASYERNPVKRHKREEALFQGKHQRANAMAAAVRGMVAPSHSTKPGRTNQALASGGESFSREIVDLLRRIATTLEAQAGEGRQRDTGRLPPKEESSSPRAHPLMGAANAGMANFGGSDPIGSAMKGAAKEAMWEAVRRGLAGLLA